MRRLPPLHLFSVALLACSQAPARQELPPPIIGAWRSSLQFEPAPSPASAISSSCTCSTRRHAHRIVQLRWRSTRAARVRHLARHRRQ